MIFVIIFLFSTHGDSTPGKTVGTAARWAAELLLEIYAAIKASDARCPHTSLSGISSATLSSGPSLLSLTRHVYRACSFLTLFLPALPPPSAPTAHRTLHKPPFHLPSTSRGFPVIALTSRARLTNPLLSLLNALDYILPWICFRISPVTRDQRINLWLALQPFCNFGPRCTNHRYCPTQLPCICFYEPSEPKIQKEKRNFTLFLRPGDRILRSGGNFGFFWVL